jgi:hypothetical protein
MICTIYKNIFSKEPHYITIDKALERIKEGKSKEKCTEIRTIFDKDRANQLKCNLPSVCFSGKFVERTDNKLIEHSSYIVLDFDGIDLIDEFKETLSKDKIIHAAWVSPSGTGVKALVKIADGKKHREHFQALMIKYPSIDRSGINESRVCYESYDPDIYINPNSQIFTRTHKVEKVIEATRVEGQQDIFIKILKWLSNKGNAFQTGERNIFIFKLASACCRFGINESECIDLCSFEFGSDNTFTNTELVRTVRSAYKRSSNTFNTAFFERDILTDRITNSEVKIVIDEDIYDPDIKPKDVIFGEDVKDRALNIFTNGYEAVRPIGIDELDEFFKFKKGEITLLSGIGNYGKSSFLKYYLLYRVVVLGEKFALFAPEDNPAEEFYHSLTEIYLGCDLTPRNYNRPSIEIYERYYDFISKSIFFVYPKEIAPTPDYIKERFLELIIKEKINGCIIDPFNQLANDYGKRSDKYLESFLAECSRFAQINDVYFTIVAHPKSLRKETGHKNYPCPDVFDIADGAMWNNKMDNILIYHRPNHQEDPTSPICELHTKKIRRRAVGKKGVLSFELDWKKRRYLFNGIDYLSIALKETQSEIKFEPKGIAVPKEFDVPF